MSEKVSSQGEAGQGENQDGSFFSIFGKDPTRKDPTREDPAPVMEISHQQVLNKSIDASCQAFSSQVASKLLSDGLLLTALELHTELLESGRELPRFVKDLFVVQKENKVTKDIIYIQL